MKRKTSKPLALNKETLRHLENLSGELLREAAGGATTVYTWSCSCDCSGGNNSKTCCL
jgi:hypothetical protein